MNLWKTNFRILWSYCLGLIVKYTKLLKNKWTLHLNFQILKKGRVSRGQKRRESTTTWLIPKDDKFYLVTGMCLKKQRDSEGKELLKGIKLIE